LAQRHIPFGPNEIALKRIKLGPLKSDQKRHAEKVRNIIQTKREVKAELGRLSRRDLWLLGLGLYLGEESKLYESTRIINSDPDIIQI
jgi:hypothetical protein